MSGLSCPPCTGNCNQGRDCPARFPLDMNNIAAQALAPKVRRWRVGLDCDGKPYTWEGTAISPEMADILARDHLDGIEPLFCPVRARTTSMVEV